jgi:hypothetical protein
MLRVTSDLFSAASLTFMVPKRYQLATLDKSTETLVCLRLKCRYFCSVLSKGGVCCLRISNPQISHFAEIYLAILALYAKIGTDTMT